MSFISLGLGFNRSRLKPFTPKKLSGLIAWYDAQDAASQFSDVAGTVLASGAVALWKDKSGYNNHLSQSTAANQPVCNEALNGFRALAFDGVNDRMINASGMAAVTGGDYTIFVVGQKRALSNNGAIFFFSGAQSVYIATDFADSSAQVNAGAGATYNFNYTSDTDPHVYVMKKSGNSATVWTDALRGLDFAAANMTNTGFHLGANAAGSFSNNMRYGEVLIYGRALTPAEEARVRSYLRARWGLEELRIVGRGGFVPTATTYPAGNTRSERRSRLVLGNGPVEYIRLQYANRVLADGERAGPNAITVEAGIEYNGVTVMASFGGASTRSIAAGAWALSDPIYPAAFGLSEFPANWDAFVRTGCIVSSGQSWPFTEYQQYETIAGVYAVVSNSASSQIAGTGPLAIPTGGATGSSPNIGCFGPSAILGKWKGAGDISVLALGDSIVDGLGDVTDNGTAGGGFINRGLRSVAGRSVPFLKISKSGERVEKFWSDWTSGFYRRHMMQYATHLIDEFGTNDLFFGGTLAAILTNKQRIWECFRCIGKGPRRVSNIPLMPRTTTTDAFVTVANQTPVANYGIGQGRDSFNSSVTALVGQSSGPDQVIDVNMAIEDQTVKARWRVNGIAGAPTSDGIHPAATGAGWAGGAVTSAAQSWTL